MTQPDSLTGLTRRVTFLENRAEDTRDALRSIDRRLDRLETAMLHQQTILDGLLETVGNVARTQAEHSATLAEHGRRLDSIDGKLDEILRRLPAPPSA